MTKNVETHVLNQYTLLRQMGNGAYGIVWEVQQKSSKKHYALKKVFDAFRNNIDAQRTYREVQILRQLSHQNIIKLLKVIKSKNKKDLYLIFEFMETDLHSIVGSNILEKMHQVYVFYQILKALKYLHSAQLIHRDLKPSNILLNSQCKVKICDFGLIRTLNSYNDQEAILSQEVATKWYRAPQLLLGSRSYKKPIDVWSFGCIVAQILTGKPMFAGDSTLNQLQKIMQFTGDVSKQDIQSLDSPVAEQLITQIKVKKRSFRQYFSSVDPDYWVMLKGALQFNPNKRMSIDQILSLQLFDEFKDQIKNLKTSQSPIKPKIDDNVRFNVKIYRQRIYEDIDKKQKSDNIKQFKKTNQLHHVSSHLKNKQFSQKQKRRAVSQDKISEKSIIPKSKFRQYSVGNAKKIKVKQEIQPKKQVKKQILRKSSQSPKNNGFYKYEGYKSDQSLKLKNNKFSPYKCYLQSMYKINNNVSSHTTILMNNYFKNTGQTRQKHPVRKKSYEKRKSSQQIQIQPIKKGLQKNKLKQLQKQTGKIIKKVSSGVMPKFFNRENILKKIGFNNQLKKY